MAAETRVTITGDASGLFKALADSSVAMKGAAREIEGAVGGLKGMFANLAAPLVAITALVGGKEFLKGTIEETKNWTVEAQKLARVLGITTEQASVLNLAIGDIYGTQEEYLGAVAKLTKTLNGNEEAFKRLGVATRDENGRLRDTPGIMADVNAALMKMESGTHRNIASSQIYGKSWMEVQRYLKLTPEVMAEAQAKAEKLNLIVGADSVAATDAYRASMNDLEDTLKAVKLRIGQELMPVMTEFNNSVSKEAPAALTTLGVVAKLVVTAFKSVAFAINLVIAGVIAWGSAAGKVLVGLWDGLSWALAGEFGKAGEVIKGGFADAHRELQAGNAVVQKDWEKLGESLSNIWDGPSGKKKSSTDTASGTASPKEKDEDKEFERLKSRAQRFNYYIEAAGQERGEYREATKAQEAAFWKAILDTEDISDKTRAKAQQEYYKAARAELKKHHDESRALDESYRDRYVAEQMALLNEEEAAATRSLALGKITEQQGLDWKRAIEQDKYELELSALRDRLAVKGLEPIELSKLHGQIEALEASHQAKVRELTNQQADLNLQKDGWAGWAAGIKGALQQAQNHFEIFRSAAQQVMSGITNAFASGIEGILSGQMSLGQGMKAIWGGIVKAVIGAVAQLVAQWIVMSVVGAGLKSAENVADGARTTASLTTAAAETWAAYSWIPFYGPLIAEAQIAAMGASMAAAAVAASAVGGKVATGRAVGGRVDKPELTMLGENGPEVVAPENTFLDWAANLEANIMARQSAVGAYGRQAASFANSAPQGGGQATQIHIHQNAPVWDPSQRGLRGMGESLIDALRASVGERSVVLTSGQVFGTL